jgi:MipA family protein
VVEPTQPWAGLAQSVLELARARLVAFLDTETLGTSMQYPTKSRAQLTMTLAVLPFALWHGAVHAQASIEEPPVESDGDGLPDWLGWIIGPSSPGQGNQFAIGVGGAYMPAHIGSKKYRFQPLPAIDIKYGRFFVTFEDGIGANLIDSETVTIGAGITMADNYRAKDVPKGIGKLSFGVGGRGFVKLRQFGFEATAGVTKIFAGSTGGILADFSLSRPIIVSDRIFLNPSIGATWANRRHNNRYFGVNAQQSLASGLSQFSTGSGFLDAKAELGLQYRLTDRIGLGLVGGVTTMVGNAKNSPIVEQKTSPFGIGFISYSF